ncbi:hypothetical protein GCM10027048_18410 [Hymenobacter coalescens]
MAVGFTPSYTETIALPDLTVEQALVVALETALQLQWRVAHLSTAGLVAYTNNGMFSGNYQFTLRLYEEHAELRSESMGSELIDFGKNKRTVQRFVAAWANLRATADAAVLQARYEQLAPDLVPAEDDHLRQPAPTAKDSWLDFLRLFKPAEGYVVTPVLLNLNLLVFVVMALSGVSIVAPTGENLLAWGANFRPLTLDGEAWRLLTNCFVHIGVLHLLMNLYALLYIGALLEPLIGPLRFGAAYLLTGVAASLTSLWWHDFTISAGASGAIFGLYGVFLAMLTTNLLEAHARKTLLSSIGLFVGYNLLFGLKGGIDNAAHIGGLLSGLLMGYAFYPSLQRREQPRLAWLTTGALAAVVGLGATVVCQQLPNDLGLYDAGMKSFTAQESMALEVAQVGAGTAKDEVLYGLKDRGIYYWEQNLRLVQRLDSLNLPAEYHQRNRVLEAYCQLRLRSYRMMYRAVQEDTRAYDDSLQVYNQQIEELLASVQEK